MPTISIIVPVYNTEKYLHRCIDSILAQTFKDFELLLIDDGSTDNSGKICDEYAVKDKRVRVFHKNNGGGSSARNLGLDNAKSKWVTFCDSDDYVREFWLQAFMDNNINADLVCQGMELDYSRMSNGSKNNICVGFDYEGEITKGVDLLFQYGLLGSMCLKMFKLEVIKENNLKLDLRFNYMEDQEFVIRYIKYCKTLKIVKSPGYYYFYLSYQQLEKYVIKNQFELYQSLFVNVNNIIDEKSPLYSHYINEYSRCLLEEFNHKISFSKLKEYRNNVGHKVFKVGVFWFTRWLIYWDRTLLLSSITLVLHNKVKRKILNCY